MGYMTIEYSGGVRPSQTTTTYERKYGQLSQPGQRIAPGKITIRDDRVDEFIRAMKYAGYGTVVRSYGAYSSGQPTSKAQVLMGMAAETQFEQEKQRQLEAANKTDVSFQGPVPKGASEETFRKTGKTIVQQRSFIDMARDPYNLEQRQSKIQTQQSRAYQGPIPQGTSEQVFRETGRTEQVQKTDFQKKVEQQATAQPLGTPTQEVKKPWYKTAFHEATDFLSGIAGGVYLEHLGRPTTRTAPEIKQQFKSDVEFATSDYRGPITWEKIGAYVFGGSNLAQTKFIVKSGQTAREFRREGELTQAQQKQQIEAVEQSTKSIEKLQTEFTPEYEKRVTQLNKEASKLEAEIEAFNIAYGKRELSSGQFYLAQQKQAELEAKKRGLTTQQKELQAEYDLYEKEILGEIGELRKLGIKTEVQPTGELAFTSQALQKELAPVGMKLQKSYLSKEGKVTWKNIAYGGGAVARATAEAFVLGAVTGGTGVLAKAGTVISKLPKGVKVGTYVVAGGLAVAGTGAKAYQGYVYGERVGVGKIGAVVGGLTAVGQLGGFVAGGYVGTKAYYGRLEQNIISGKYTRMTKKMIRQGQIAEKKAAQQIMTRGKAGQKVVYETKIKGTDFKIKTEASLVGKYAGKRGGSVVEVKSTLVGKKIPKGLAKQWETYGRTLESQKYVKARIFTKSSKQKAWTQQDVLIKRKFLEKLKVKFDEPKILYDPKTDKALTIKEIEAFKFKSDIKLLGEASKVKQIPNEVWTKSEAWRFKHLGSLRKGQAAVLRLSQRNIGTPELKEITKQVVLYSPKEQMGPYTLRTFRSVGQAGGISDKLLKDLVSKEIAKIRISKVGKFLKLDTKGQVMLQKPQPILKRPTIPFKIKDTSLLSQEALVKTALKGQLSQIAPSLLSKQCAALLPGAVSISATTLGLRNILTARAATMSAIKTEQISSLKTDMITRMATKVAQVQVTQPILMQQTITPTITQLAVATPVITTAIPSMPTVPRIPIIPPTPKLPRGFRQRGYRKPTGRPKEKGIYVEGFTAKALGLEAKAISQAQAKALLKKVLTGLEIRRRVVVQKTKKRRRKK